MTTASKVTVETLVDWLNQEVEECNWFRLAGLAREIGGVVRSAGLADSLAPEARNAVEHYHGAAA